MFIFFDFLINEGFEFEFFNKIFCGMFFDKLMVLFLIIFSGETFLDLFILVLVWYPLLKLVFIVDFLYASVSI